ncbi:hypothetical protein BJY01DRAFT_214369 [Aspergillus pseudoustus]|uniref:Uncharacterized protein n=1 Tax=Aspergillus pseudoustus TaxID=1810923 RepID=A0ABR4JZ83_9EURO
MIFRIRSMGITIVLAFFTMIIGCPVQMRTETLIMALHRRPLCKKNYWIAMDSHIGRLR